MKRNQKSNRNVDENADMSRTDIQRQDRTMGAGARGDQNAGSEGIDEPSSDRTNRMGSTDRKTGENMRESSRQHSTEGTDNDRQQGRESNDGNGAGFHGQGDQREGAENPEGTGYTNDASHDTGDVGNPLV